MGLYQTFKLSWEHAAGVSGRERGVVAMLIFPDTGTQILNRVCVSLSFGSCHFHEIFLVSFLFQSSSNNHILPELRAKGRTLWGAHSFFPVLLDSTGALWGGGLVFYRHIVGG